MADSKELFRRAWFWVIAGISGLVLVVLFVFMNPGIATGWFGASDASEREARKLEDEISEIMERLSQDENAIAAARLEVESKLNRIEGLLRTPRSSDEQAELGKDLRAEEGRWALLQEQADFFERWGVQGPVITEARESLSGATQALNEGRDAEVLESLRQVHSAIEPLLNLRATLEKVQKARLAYGRAKQEIDIIATTYRVSEIPGGGELLALEKDAIEALEKGEFEKSLESWQSAIKRIGGIRADLFDVAIEKAKQAASDAIKAGDPAAARAALKRAKELGRTRDAGGVGES